MLMRTSTHHKMVEADTVKIAEQGSLIRKLQAQVQELKTRNMDLWATKDDAVERAEKVFAANLKLASQLRVSEQRYDKLEARLAVFTAPRKRNSRGWFVSGKQEQAA